MNMQDNVIKPLTYETLKNFLKQFFKNGLYVKMLVSSKNILVINTPHEQ
jgi:hypothetical protein